MELDELKATWSQYEKKLSKNLKVNEELLRKMNLNSAKREFTKLFNLDIITIAITFIAGFYLLMLSLQYISEIKYSIPGLIASLLMFITLYFSILKVYRSKKIDYYQGSVVKLQKDITELTQLVLRIRRYEVALGTFFAVTVFPVLYRSIDIDLYSNPRVFIFKIGLVIVLGVGLGTWINKSYVDKKMKNANRFLEDIAAFEREE